MNIDWKRIFENLISLFLYGIPMSILLAVVLYFCTSAEAQELPQSGDTVIIGDMKYIIVHSSDWVEITNNVQTCIDTWAKLNETETGRTAIHGKRGHTTITNGEITVEYADGWKRTEKIKRNSVKPTTQTSKVNKTTPPTIESRREAIRRKREEAMKTIREITVIKEAGK